MLIEGVIFWTKPGNGCADWLCQKYCFYCNEAILERVAVVPLG
jgi:hypothetical protein